MSLFFAITISDIIFYCISIIDLFVSQAKGFAFSSSSLHPTVGDARGTERTWCCIKPKNRKVYYFAMIKHDLICVIHQWTYISV